MQLIRIKSIKITHLWSWCYFSRCGLCHSQRLAQFTLFCDRLVNMKDSCLGGVPHADCKQSRQRPGPPAPQDHLGEKIPRPRSRKNSMWIRGTATCWLL